jgi:biopolymer transport protein ExbD
MAFKNQSEDQDVINEINVTPLVDVMLVLVIILLVTAPLLTQSVHVNLPKTAATTPDIKDQPIQVGIDANTIITLNKQPIADLAVLETTLKTELEKNSEAAVHIYADEAVPYGKVAQVMAAAQHAGISKLAFVSIED